MTDTQNSSVPNIMLNDDDTSTTPSRRGHKHKRSFAISGDFEFLKQPVPTLTQADQDDQPWLSPKIDCPKLLFSESSNVDPGSNFRSGRRNSTNPNPEPLVNLHAPLYSPRYFASEEPKFSSPFQGVPDAIINLDDALKTKPRSFRSHRRTESAPADLEVLLSAKNIQWPPSRIEEEDASDIELDMNNNKENILPALLSPLRPSTASRIPEDHDRINGGSPIQLRKHSFNNQGFTCNMPNSNSPYNSLKINKQKQRSYTRQLPMSNASSTVQPQSLKEQASNTSLSSSFAMSPSSFANTPSKQVSTPGTPLSFGYKNNKGTSDKFSDIKTTSSPALYSYHQRVPVARSNNNINANTFNFASKVYDFPYNSSSRDNITQHNNASDENFDNTINNHDIENEGEFMDSNNLAPLSQDILLGEPGDTVDLSSIVSPTKSMKYQFDSLTINSQNYLKSGESSNISLSGKKPLIKEPRSVSDTAVIIDKSAKGKNKRKSKLNAFMSLFSKDD